MVINMNIVLLAVLIIILGICVMHAIQNINKLNSGLKRVDMKVKGKEAILALLDGKILSNGNDIYKIVLGVLRYKDSIEHEWLTSSRFNIADILKFNIGFEIIEEKDNKKLLQEAIDEINKKEFFNYDRIIDMLKFFDNKISKAVEILEKIDV